MSSRDVIASALVSRRTAADADANQEGGGGGVGWGWSKPKRVNADRTFFIAALPALFLSVFK